MLRLWLLIFAIASTAMMGIGMIVALVMNSDNLGNITGHVIIGVVIGLLLSFPASWLIAKRIYGSGKNEDAPRIDEGPHGQFTKG